jgi:hypothetical protein
VICCSCFNPLLSCDFFNSFRCTSRGFHFQLWLKKLIRPDFQKPPPAPCSNYPIEFKSEGRGLAIIKFLLVSVLYFPGSSLGIVSCIGSYRLWVNEGGPPTQSLRDFCEFTWEFAFSDYLLTLSRSDWIFGVTIVPGRLGSYTLLLTSSEIIKLSSLI